ncbi:glycoside hydrolase family 76 protein [Amycolatopsis jejuensis]|uniref:glycoside hydrolase family 76 protein n=1 Tax=Amycolatopsis jejuensis TaxID=330084 RepID=UPI000AD06A51|nr:glycoside hydrolase family 76 protein [Amycolatopsis jejuensis]
MRVMLTVVATTMSALLAAGPPSGEPTTPHTAADNTVVCNKYCDNRAADQATGDRIAVTTPLDDRVLQLHFADNDPMGWAAIDHVKPGDSVWLDRSFDAGSSWTGGSQLGLTKAPSGIGAWRTQMYNNDDWNNRGVGALRACGSAVDTGRIACTPWARTRWNAANRAQAAATAMMATYDNGTGYFRSSSGWGSAVSLSGVIRDAVVTGMGSYEYAIATTYDKNVNAGRGQFRNEFSDDTGWWAMAWLDAYDRTGQQRYLDTAKAEAEHMQTFWTGDCGGGIRWQEGQPYKASISNSLYLQVNATLADRTGSATYRTRAQQGWEWFRSKGLIGSDGLVIDGVDGSSCAAVGKRYTYNQGVLVSALIALSRVNGDQGLITTARSIADATTRTGSYFTGSDGIVGDPGESSSCTDDGSFFKAGLVRGLSELDAAVSGAPYRDFLVRQADSAYARSRNDFDQYSRSWSGGTGKGPGCQAGGLALMNATHQ